MDKVFHTHAFSLIFYCDPVKMDWDKNSAGNLPNPPGIQQWVSHTQTYHCSRPGVLECLIFVRSPCALNSKLFLFAFGQASIPSQTALCSKDDNCKSLCENPLVWSVIVACPAIEQGHVCLLTRNIIQEFGRIPEIMFVV